MNWYKILLPLFCVAFMAAGAKTIYENPLSRGKWSMKEWEMVKSSRSDYIGQWLQLDDRIINRVPEGTDPSTFITSATTTFTAMLYKRSFTGDVTVSVECGFACRMAPGILIAAEPLRSGHKIGELAEHFEIILYDNGLNVWHHYFENDKQKWIKKHFLLQKGVFAPNKFHKFSVSVITRKGRRFLEVAGNDQVIGYCEPEMFSGSYRVGIVASEGANFFRNIRISVPETDKK